MFATGKTAYPSSAPVYVEDVFSTYLYDGTAAVQTITNGIDLSTKGGMVWMKNRVFSYNHAIVDSARGLTNGNILYTNTTNPAMTGYPENTAGISTFNIDGFTLRSDANGVGTNYASTENIVSWTFRAQPKFFALGTYTGDGALEKVITHTLNGTTGCIMVKRTDTTGDWIVYHRTFFNTRGYVYLNSSAPDQNLVGAGVNMTVTNTSFTVGTNQIFGNVNGATYVYYVFAHNSGGFGLTGTDNIISCGSFTATGQNINLGFEPQWLLTRRVEGNLGDWKIYDNSRAKESGSSGRAWRDSGSLNTTNESLFLTAESTNAEVFGANYGHPTSNGFFEQNNPAGTHMYIAIRRGPMKPPTVGTSVFKAISRSGTYPSSAIVTGVGFPPDLIISKSRLTTYPPIFYDRLRGPNRELNTSTNDVETHGLNSLMRFAQDGYYVNRDGVFESAGAINYSSTYINWIFRRAPSFFDQVCYTGAGGNLTVPHNLGVAPELMIVKFRHTLSTWRVYAAGQGATQQGVLNTSDSFVSAGVLWQSTTPTASVFYVGNDSSVNAAGGRYVAYLFATCPGVSKVGTYTGTGSPQTIDCGFTTGARFVMLKCTSLNSTNWVLFDSVRGIVSGIDTFLYLNSTINDQSTLDLVAPQSVGFGFGSESYYGEINQSGQTYIFLAIA